MVGKGGLRGVKLRAKLHRRPSEPRLDRSAKDRRRAALQARTQDRTGGRRGKHDCSKSPNPKKCCGKVQQDLAKKPRSAIEHGRPFVPLGAPGGARVGGRQGSGGRPHLCRRLSRERAGPVSMKSKKPEWRQISD